MTEKKKNKDEMMIKIENELKGVLAQNEKLLASTTELSTQSDNLINSANQLAAQLNNHMQLTSHYETTINILTGRIKEKDNLIAQLNQKMQQGGE
jgi:hypothetical protein|tara:strand:- start:3291 stop:3575 length:285 start_codon:yes stop_codon:yes gene_type:complete